jgi:cytidylate kinase
MIITIDGPTGTGKSTIAKLLAERLGFIHFDTGAMYRCLTHGIIKNNIDIDDEKPLEDYLDTFSFQIKIINGEKHYFVKEEDVTKSIRGEAVTALVSKVAAIPTVRHHLVRIQRKFAEGVNSVFEGRDIGTVVFPNAELKIYLTASSEVRAQRRFKELLKKFPEESKTLTLEKVLEDVDRRDSHDSTREHSPLRQADDAHLVDTSNLTIEQVLEEILKLVRTKGP